MGGSTGAAPARVHVPALDGARGLAVLLVMSGHTWRAPSTGVPERAGASLVTVGWSGVELFFVLSGFLITGILLDAKGTERYFRNFYLRRVLRILPLYYALLAAAFVGAALLPHLIGRLLGSANGEHLWYLFHLSNFAMAGRGQFAPAPLGVTWSLAVEEQFYLVWPFVVLALPGRWLLRLCLALVVASTLWRLVLLGAHVDAVTVYLVTPSQVGGLAIGGALAVALRGPGGLQPLLPWARWMLVLGPALVAAIGLAAAPGGFSFDPARPLAVGPGMLVVQLTAAALVVAALSGTLLPSCMRLLEGRVMRALGRWSFAMYLFHTPLVLVLFALSQRHGWPSLLGSMLPAQLAFTAVCVGATTALAALSWRFFEQPVMRLKRLFPMGEPSRRLPAPAEPLEDVGAAA